jgi:hypothetical protein
MFVSPLLLASRKSVIMSRWWRRIRNLRNEISGRSLSNPINENTQERYPLEDVEADAETKQETFSVMEPMFLLLLGKSDAREIWFELRRFSREQKLIFK